MEAFALIPKVSIEIGPEQLAGAGNLELYFCPALTVVGFDFINQPAVVFIQGDAADQAVARLASNNPRNCWRHFTRVSFLAQIY